MRTEKITPQLIESIETDRGGFTKADLAILGVDWPPKAGWKKDPPGFFVKLPLCTATGLSAFNCRRRGFCVKHTACNE